MAPATRGTFVISWSQTAVDGCAGPRSDMLVAGALWRWTGDALRLDQPGVLRLEAPEGAADLRRRAARMVARLVGAAVNIDTPAAPDAPEPPDQGFTLTDGRQSYAAALIPVPESTARLVMFAGEMPPADRDLWIVHSDIPQPGAAVEALGTICFTPGTRIATPRGPRLIEDLRPGDLVDTADAGAQPVLWVGQRRISGGRLFAMPALRPIRIRAGAFGTGQPDGDLLVSPDHRMLLRGRAAEALFGTPEVLVRARDLIDGRKVRADGTLREVTYVHLLLDRHHILFANGMESESFHPASAAPESLDPDQSAGLAAHFPDLGAYGGHARRNLSASEAAILRFEAA